MPAEPAPGQAAHAAFVEARFPHLDRADLAWREFTDDQRKAWAAADATVAAPLNAEIASLREQLAQARAERDSYRRLAGKIGDSLCSNASHAAKIRTIWELTELAPQAAADAAREALEGGG